MNIVVLSCIGADDAATEGRQRASKGLKQLNLAKDANDPGCSIW